MLGCSRQMEYSRLPGRPWHTKVQTVALHGLQPLGSSDQEILRARPSHHATSSLHAPLGSANTGRIPTSLVARKKTHEIRPKRHQFLWSSVNSKAIHIQNTEHLLAAAGLARGGSRSQRHPSSVPGSRPQGPLGLGLRPLFLLKRMACFVFLPSFPKPAMGLTPSKSSGKAGTRPLGENMCEKR